MECENHNANGYEVLLKGASLLPMSHCYFFLAFVVLIVTIWYNFLEFHFFHDLFTLFRGDAVSLTYKPNSLLYRSVASHCRLLHSRYLPTPWLSGPHLQTAFLSFFGRAPVVHYRRQIFHTPDGGTLALDWLLHTGVKGASSGDQIPHDDKTPIAVIVPGLTSDSSAAYVKHIAVAISERGWNVVVSNHRGLGGISITSDCFYNAGWTDDVRRVINYLHSEVPEAPLFAIGTSIGANILVKYLAEEGFNIPVAGAAAVCSPWDLLVYQPQASPKTLQQGADCWSARHQAVLSRLTDWDSITKSRSVRDFDDHATRVLGKYETVDTYYRRCSSVNFVGNVAVPLLCISALDDPVCSREAIPWDECRTNENIILAITQHGGHLAYYEGISAQQLWWVRAVDEFLGVLNSSPYMHQRKEMQASPLPVAPESSIDRGPYVNVTEDGMVAAVGDEEMKDVAESRNEQTVTQTGEDDKSNGKRTEGKMEEAHERSSKELPDQLVSAIMDPVKRRLDHLSRQSCKSIWLLIYIAIIATWPLVGPALVLALKKRWRTMLLAKMLKR